MNAFAFRLEALLKYRVARRDRCRQLLAQLLADDRSLVEQQRAIAQERRFQLDELRRLGNSGSLDVDRSINRRYYAARLVAEVNAVDRSRALLARQLVMCRQTLARAEQEVKVLTKLKEKRRAEFLYEEDRRAARELDEIWMAAHNEELSR